MKKFIDLLYWIYIEIKICQPHKKVEFTGLLYNFKQNINLQYLYFIFKIIKSKFKYPNDKWYLVHPFRQIYLPTLLEIFTVISRNLFWVSEALAHA